MEVIEEQELMKQQELIGHGAQAKLFKFQRDGLTFVRKQRFPKKYRHPQLDKKINQSRIRSEAKIMRKLLQKGINVPHLIKVDEPSYSIEMVYVPGIKLKDYINDPSRTEEQLKFLLRLMGCTIKKVHEAGIIHGDLTTSNMIMSSETNSIALIDFGLSYFKQSAEDKAVDLYVLQRAFKSTHPHLQHLFDNLIITYQDESVLKKLEVVRQRGRKKVAFG